LGVWLLVVGWLDVFVVLVEDNRFIYFRVQYVCMERIEGKFLVVEAGDIERWIPREMTNRAAKLPVWQNARTYIKYVLYDENGKKWTWRHWGTDTRMNHGTVLKMKGFVKEEGKLTRMKILETISQTP